VTFEIGSTLRDERRRRGLGLDDVQSATRIRAHFLDAIEREDFDALPAGSYRRSFVRGYADFLGLDGDVYAGEYEQRVAPPEPEPEAVRVRARPRLRVSPVLALAATGIALALALGGWLLARSGGSPSSAPPPATGVAGAATTERSHHRTPPPQPAALVVTAARGTCWLLVKSGSSTGATVVERTLQRGDRLRLGLGRPLWIRIGAPWNVDATIAGQSVELPAHTGNVVATPSGVRPAA